MDIHIRKRPIIVTGYTRDSLESKIERRFMVTGHSFGTYGSGWISYNPRIAEYVMVNYQKFRSKRGVRKSHWIAYVYTFNVNFLKSAGLQVIQKTRHFYIMEK